MKEDFLDHACHYHSRTLSDAAPFGDWPLIFTVVCGALARQALLGPISPPHVTRTTLKGSLV